MLNNIQILRAFAALNVVLFHILGASAALGLAPPSLSFLQGWGECGVDVFFVISGFVMIVAHADKDMSPIAFMTQRIYRIVPIYWLLTLLVLAAYALMPHMVKSAAPSTGHIATSLFFLSGVLLDKPPVLYVGWTLEYEMLFYLLFSLSLFLPRSPWRIWLQALGMAVAIWWGDASTVVIEFLFGVLAGELFLRRTLRKHAPTIAITGIALLCASIFVIPAMWSRLIVWGLPSLMIVWGAAACRQFDSRALAYLGAASYSIYLMQVIALPAFYKVASRNPVIGSNDVLALIAFIVTTLSGCLLHQYIEKPVAAWLKAHRLSSSLQRS